MQDFILVMTSETAFRRQAAGRTPAQVNTAARKKKA